jgi:hypothetical protein
MTKLVDLYGNFLRNAQFQGLVAGKGPKKTANY